MLDDRLPNNKTYVRSRKVCSTLTTANHILSSYAETESSVCACTLQDDRRVSLSLTLGADVSNVHMTRDSGRPNTVHPGRRSRRMAYSCRYRDSSTVTPPIDIFLNDGPAQAHHDNTGETVFCDGLPLCGTTVPCLFLSPGRWMQDRIGNVMKRVRKTSQRAAVDIRGGYSQHTTLVLATRLYVSAVTN